MKYLGDCSFVESKNIGFKADYCCTSCHEDWDTYDSDYPMSEYESPDKEKWVSVCCAKTDEFDEIEEKFWKATP